MTPARVAVLYMRPETDLEDYFRLFELARGPALLDGRFEHDYTHWPLKEKRVYEHWRSTTEWGKMFSQYQQRGRLR